MKELFFKYKVCSYCSGVRQRVLMMNDSSQTAICLPCAKTIYESLDTIPDREEGYYKVRTSSVIRLAEWMDGEWWVMGAGEPFQDSEVEVLSERVLMP